jgi:XTP/dITP diphosphohydrolase
MRLVLASHNRGKLAEVTALLAGCDLELTAVGLLGLSPPAEEAPDFVGNARIKALSAARGTGHPALADDSGFSVAALGGDPGVQSARWAEGGNFQRAMARVEAAMGATADRRAWFTCALCLAWPDGECATYVGRVDGTVVWPARGKLGFGYDSMFVPVGSRLTFGEMEPAAKQASSHRARAIAQFRAACLGWHLG